MNNKLLLLIKTHTDTLIERNKTKPRETLEVKMNKQMETFSFSPPIKSVEERKWLSSVTSFEATNSGFIITEKKNSFSISIPGRWRIPNYFPEGINDKLKNFLKFRSQNDNELHVAEVTKRGDKIKYKSEEFSLPDFDTFKKEILEELKTANLMILKI